MQGHSDLSGKMRQLPIQQAIRKSAVSHYRRQFCFKRGLNLAAWSDKEKASPIADLSVAMLFFYCVYVLPEQQVGGQKWIQPALHCHK